MNDHFILETIRNEIHAEHTLISHRMTWYGTSMSFLVGAFVVSWLSPHPHTKFFQIAIPILGLLLSILALNAILCAVIVQGNIIKTQKEVIDGIGERFQRQNDEDGLRRVKEYCQVMGRDRRSGFMSHWLGVMPPIMIPFFFSALWIIGLCLK